MHVSMFVCAVCVCVCVCMCVRTILESDIKHESISEGEPGEESDSDEEERPNWTKEVFTREREVREREQDGKS